MFNNMYFKKITWKIRHLLLNLRVLYLRRVFGMNIHPTVRVSLKANLDKTNPAGIHIDEYSYVAFDAVILTHDMASSKSKHVIIGKNCFIGARSFILPDVKIGDGSIVAACSVVTKDVPSGVIVAGNPARVVKENIVTGKYGQMIDDHK